MLDLPQCRPHFRRKVARHHCQIPSQHTNTAYEHIISQRVLKIAYVCGAKLCTTKRTFARLRFCRDWRYYSVQPADFVAVISMKSSLQEKVSSCLGFHQLHARNQISSKSLLCMYTALDIT